MAGGANLWNVRATVAKGAVARVEESLTRALGGRGGALEGPGDRILAVTANALGDDATDGPHRLWRVEILCAMEPDAAALAHSMRELDAVGIGMEPRVRRVPDRDWSIFSRSSREPVRVGRFFVRASDYDGPRPGGAIELIVNGGPAFGTGTHESTRGCLIAIDDLAKRGRIRRPLDLGTGTGILAMAMRRTWNRRVLGVDIDPRAVEFARRVACVNRLRRQVEFVTGDGCRCQRVSEGGPYDLIVANILAAPLIGMAKDIGRRVSPGGRVILSGILTHQERRVFAAYRRNGMRLEKRIGLGDWTTLVLRRPPRDARAPTPARLAAGIVGGRTSLGDSRSGAVPPRLGRVSGRSFAVGRNDGRKQRLESAGGDLAEPLADHPEDAGESALATTFNSRPERFVDKVGRHPHDEHYLSSKHGRPMGTGQYPVSYDASI